MLIKEKPLSCFIAEASDDVVGKWSPAVAGIWVGIYGLLPFISQLVLGIITMKLMPQGKAATNIPVDNQAGSDDSSIAVNAPTEILIPAKEMSSGSIAVLDSIAKLCAQVVGTNVYQEAARMNTYRGTPSSALDFPQGALDNGAPAGSSNMPSSQTITAVLTALTTAGAYIASKYAHGVCNYEMQ